MPFASIVSTDYKLALFLHIVAVVLAFGPTFGYAFFFSVVPKYPRAAPAVLEGIQKVDRFLVNPGMIVILLAGIYLLVASDDAWDGGDAFISVGFLAIIVLFGLQHAYFQPKVRQLKEIADRDLQKGDSLSEEFETIGEQVGKVGTLAGLIVVVTIFFMSYKPFM